MITQLIYGLKLKQVLSLAKKVNPEECQARSTWGYHVWCYDCDHSKFWCEILKGGQVKLGTNTISLFCINFENK